jgi:hypothetical protein
MVSNGGDGKTSECWFQIVTLGSVALPIVTLGSVALVISKLLSGKTYRNHKLWNIETLIRKN